MRLRRSSLPLPPNDKMPIMYACISMIKLSLAPPLALGCPRPFVRMLLAMAATASEESEFTTRRRLHLRVSGADGSAESIE